ncbi:MAG: AAA family ATPase, partial [Pseudomonadota bacterium]
SAGTEWVVFRMLVDFLSVLEYVLTVISHPYAAAAGGTLTFLLVRTYFYSFKWPRAEEAFESNAKLTIEKTALDNQVVGLKNRQSLLDQANENLKSRNDGLAEDLAREQNINLQMSEQNSSQSKTIQSLSDDIAGIRSDLNTLQKEREQLQIRVDRFEKLKARLITADRDQWSMRPPQMPEDYERRLRSLRTRVVTIGNLKGGVGKSTIAANIAAYFQEKHHARVLLVDLDYQGTLTGLLAEAAQVDETSSVISDVLSSRIGIDAIREHKRHFPQVLKRTELVTASPKLASVEHRELMAWLLQVTKSDVRYRLANALLDPWIQDNYDYVVLDTPPRMSLAMINALCASHAYFVPTILDSASSCDASRFVCIVSSLVVGAGLNRDLQFGGVIPNQLNDIDLTNTEKDARARLAASLAQLDFKDHIFETGIRHSKKLNSAAGEKVLYTKDTIFQSGTIDKIGAIIDERVGVPPQREAAA